MSGTSGEHGPHSGGPQDQENFGKLYLPSLLGVFALSQQLHGRAPYGEPYLRLHDQINMPRAPLAVKKGREIIPLEPEAVDIITARARRLIAIPHGERRIFAPTEVGRFQALLDGTSVGMTELEIGDRLGLDRYEMQETSQGARDYLGATNQASVMYGARLHGYVPSIRPVELRAPRLTLNRRLHFFLAALGFDWNEAAELTDSSPESVKTTRGYIREKLQAESIPQAVSNGFETGVLITLREHEMQSDSGH